MSAPLLRIRRTCSVPHDVSLFHLLWRAFQSRVLLSAAFSPLITAGSSRWSNAEAFEKWALQEGTPKQRFMLAKEILDREKITIQKVGANGLVTGTAIGAPRRDGFSQSARSRRFTNDASHQSSTPSIQLIFGIRFARSPQDPKRKHTIFVFISPPPTSRPPSSSASFAPPGSDSRMTRAFSVALSSTVMRSSR